MYRSPVPGSTAGNGRPAPVRSGMPVLGSTSRTPASAAMTIGLLQVWPPLVERTTVPDEHHGVGLGVGVLDRGDEPRIFGTLLTHNASTPASSNFWATSRPGHQARNSRPL